MARVSVFLSIMVSCSGFSFTTAPSSHSPGCEHKRAPPSQWIPGRNSKASITHDGVTRTFLVRLPAKYDHTKPTSLVLNFHGWGDNSSYSSDIGLDGVIDDAGWVLVSPDGMSDFDGTWTSGGSMDWGSWNGGGTTLSPGPEGSTCTPEHDGTYCYKSCAARPQGCDKDGCDWTTCHDDIGFVASLLDHLSDELCLDLDRFHVTGCSNGGILAYELAMTSDARIQGRFASVAPVAGNVHLGFARTPPHPIHVLDIHGIRDTAVPLNETEPGRAVSADGWIYTPRRTLFLGFRQANGCTGDGMHFPTKYDGRGPGLYCVEVGECSFRTVRCAWDGNHATPGDGWSDTSDKGLFGVYLIRDFFLDHPRRQIRPNSTNGKSWGALPFVLIGLVLLVLMGGMLFLRKFPFAREKLRSSLCPRMGIHTKRHPV